MSALLGIDTGGTYTDAVLFDPQRGLLASAKSLTRRHDLTLGIRESLSRVLSGAERERIELVGLSTTLATNAVVEGQGSSVCLILIGYPDDALRQSRLGEVMGADPVVFVRGGHDATGREAAALDMGKARKAVERFAGKVSAFAVSGYFSVRNPSHENEVRSLIRRRCGLPVTCGHELTTNLHASRRALTAALNARLVPVLSELIQAVRRMLEESGLEAPLMVVKGDGSLVEAGFALEYPVETILSGPAASVIGSLYLSGKRDACVVDMGGTTTDIALVEEGRPVLNQEGATVGGWQTMVEAVRVHTFGLGGDSEVSWDEKTAGLKIGPRRLVPLSLLASEHPEVLSELERQVDRRAGGSHDGRFVLRLRARPAGEPGSGELRQRILERIADGKPRSLESLLQGAESQFLLEAEIGRLMSRGYLAIAGFTPTDAAHVLGYQDTWCRQAAELGARLAVRCHGWLQRPSGGSGPGAEATAAEQGAEATAAEQSAEATAAEQGAEASSAEQGAEASSARRVPAPPAAEQLCRQVLDQVILCSGRSLLSAVLAERYGVQLEAFPRLRELFVDGALLPGEGAAGLLQTKLSLKRPLVAIGAPVATYYPEVARRLDSELSIPAHAAVANAIGAVVGSVMQSVRVLISSQDGGEVYRVHLEDGIHDFRDLEEAASFAAAAAEKKAGELALQAGAWSPQLTVQRRDSKPVVGGEQFFLQSLIVARAAGRPRLVHDGAASKRS